MNPTKLIIVMFALASSYAMADGLRADCEQQVKAAVTAAEGEYTLSDDGKTLQINGSDLDSIQILNVKVIKSVHAGGGGEDTMDTTSTADVKDGLEGGLTGTVQVTATRGGCFVEKLNLHQ